MSKIGKKIILIPEGVSVVKNDGVLEIKKGAEVVNLAILEYIEAKISKIEEEGKETNTLEFSLKSSIKQARSNWGTMRALAQNAIDGIVSGFKKALEIEGVGYRASMEGENLVLNVGLSHPVKYIPQKGIKIEVEKNLITVSGISKEAVGQTAAEIRKIKKPEPYKGKGIRYQGEVIRRKQGKKVGK